jgi:hypothetical protein
MHSLSSTFTVSTLVNRYGVSIGNSAVRTCTRSGKDAACDFTGRITSLWVSISSLLLAHTRLLIVFDSPP